MRKLKTCGSILTLYIDKTKNSSKTRQENKACLFLFFIQSFILAGNPTIAAKYEECVLLCSLLFSLYKHLSLVLQLLSDVQASPLLSSHSATSNVRLRPCFLLHRELREDITSWGLCKIFWRPQHFVFSCNSQVFLFVCVSSRVFFNSTITMALL